jgi:Arc/MetJ-type ribon-helix-helix transcriptional regulator
VPDVQKISIALTAEQVAALKAAVDAGEYATTSEVVRDAIRDQVEIVRVVDARRDLSNLF